MRYNHLASRRSICEEQTEGMNSYKHVFSNKEQNDPQQDALRWLYPREMEQAVTYYQGCLQALFSTTSLLYAFYSFHCYKEVSCTVRHGWLLSQSKP